MRTERESTSDELGILLNQLFSNSQVGMGGLEGMIISSVVPPMNSTYDDFARRYLGVPPIFVGPGVKTGMPILL